MRPQTRLWVSDSRGGWQIEAARHLNLIQGFTCWDRRAVGASQWFLKDMNHCLIDSKHFPYFSKFFGLFSYAAHKSRKINARCSNWCDKTFDELIRHSEFLHCSRSHKFISSMMSLMNWIRFDGSHFPLSCVVSCLVWLSLFHSLRLIDSEFESWSHREGKVYNRSETSPAITWLRMSIKRVSELTVIEAFEEMSVDD